MASKRRIRRNACMGKRQYDTAQAATEALYGLHRAKGFQGVMNAYKCQFCHKYHFGHLTRAGRIARAMQTGVQHWK